MPISQFDLRWKPAAGALLPSLGVRRLQHREIGEQPQARILAFLRMELHATDAAPRAD